MENIKLEDVKSVLESRILDILKEMHDVHFDDDDWMYENENFSDIRYLEGKICSLREVYEKLFGIDAYLEFSSTLEKIK